MDKDKAKREWLKTLSDEDLDILSGMAMRRNGWSFTGVSYCMCKDERHRRFMAQLILEQQAQPMPKQ